MIETKYKKVAFQAVLRVLFQPGIAAVSKMSIKRIAEIWPFDLVLIPGEMGKIKGFDP